VQPAAVVRIGPGERAAHAELARRTPRLGGGSDGILER
jgi:hypothetical protein